MWEFEKETSIIAYLDLSNMFHWQKILKWDFSIYHVIKEIKSYSNVIEIRIYFGINERKKMTSENFHRKMRESGAIVISKPVKWIKKDISRELFVKSSTQHQFDDESNKKLDELVSYLKEQGITIEEPKCNFDVEMAIDILDNKERVSAIMLFSGDSDFHEPLKRLKISGKKVYLFGVRNMTSNELIRESTRYINFGKWYDGHKKRKSH